LQQWSLGESRYLAEIKVGLIAVKTIGQFSHQFLQQAKELPLKNRQKTSLNKTVER
jgi:hypothetical protein